MGTFSIITSFEIEEDKWLLALNILGEKKSILKKKLEKKLFFRSLPIVLGLIL